MSHSSLLFDIFLSFHLSRFSFCINLIKASAINISLIVYPLFECVYNLSTDLFTDKSHPYFYSYFYDILSLLHSFSVWRVLSTLDITVYIESVFFKKKYLTFTITYISSLGAVFVSDDIATHSHFKNTNNTSV